MSRLDAAFEDFFCAIRALNDALATLPALSEELLAEQEEIEENTEKVAEEENTITLTIPLNHINP